MFPHGPSNGRSLVEGRSASSSDNAAMPSQPHWPPPPPPLHPTWGRNLPGYHAPPTTAVSQHIPRIPLFTRAHPSTVFYHDVPVYFPRSALDGYRNPQWNGSHAQQTHLPPEDDSRFVVQDDGNASPRMLTCNMFAIPRNALILQQSVGFLGLLCQPLAIPTADYVLHDYSRPHPDHDNDHGLPPLPPDVETVPLISLQETPSPTTPFNSNNSPFNPNSLPVTPLRCQLCQAYINPFCTLLHSPNLESCTITCNFCNSRTRTSFDTFISSTTSNNSNTIHAFRPPSNSSSSSYSSPVASTTALQFGTVEYSVGGPFITRALETDESMQRTVAPSLVYLYALDVSSEPAIFHNYLHALHIVAQHIALHWDKQLHKDILPPRIGIILYDYLGQIYIPFWTRDTLHYQIQVALMLDVHKDPFIPLPLSEWTYYTTNFRGKSTQITMQNSLDGFYEMLQQLPTVLKHISPKTAPGMKAKMNFTGAALAALTHALQSKTDCLGGRIVAMTCSRPNAGLGALRDLESSHPGSSTAMYAHIESERFLYTSLLRMVENKIPFTKTPMDDSAYSFYSNLIQQCQQYNISIDIFMTTPTSVGRSFLGLATLTDVCQRTCGAFKWLKYNDLGDIEVNWKVQLREELLRSALVYSGSDAILKVRCSKGLHVKKTIPSKHLVLGTAVDSSELEFARVNADTCISFELEYDIGGIPKDNGMTSPLVYFQTALLYTTLTGHRRLRVSTLALPTTTSVTEAFQGIRFGPTCAIFIRKAIDDLYDPTDVGNLKRVGSLLTDRCVNVLSNYRNHTNAKHSACDTLAMPENLRLLPLFCLGLRKSLMLRSSLSKDATLSNTPFPNGDERAYRLFYGSRTTPVMSMICVHPTLFSILDMNADEGEWSRDLNRDTDQTSCIASHVFLPKPISPSVGILKPEGIYILDDGFTLFLFIGRDVSLERRAELLSYPCGSPQLQVSSALSKKIIRIVQQIRRYSSLGGTQQQAIRPVFSPLVLVVGTGGYGFRKGIDDILEKYMVECCVDDSSGGDSSYEDFLGEVHRRVKGKSI